MTSRLLALLAGLALALPALAIDYRSVETPGAIVMYDAPSAKGKKLYLLKPMTPLEIVVKVEGWTKVRDAEGTMAWVESKYLGERRTVVVTAPKAEIRQSDKPEAPLVFEAEKWVALELVEPATPGWVRVRHKDGSSGVVRTTQVWGL